MADLAIVKSEPIPLSITKSEPLSNAEGDALKQKGFFESAWDVVKSVPAAAVEMLTPHSRAEKEAQIQKALQFADRFVSAHQGGDEAAKKAANDELMLALPGGSTIYKAKEGNYAGAAGDIAGMAVLGGIAKAAANPAETAAIVKGGAKGAATESMAPSSVKLGKLPLSVPVPRIVSSTITGKVAGGMFGGVPGAIVGGTVGAAVPIIRGGVRGARAELAKLAPAVERPAPAWQRLAEVPEAAATPLADLSAKLQAIIDERNARALERQQTSLPPALERMVTKAKEAGSLTPEQEALASEILQNVEPAPEAVPPASAPPETAPRPISWSVTSTGRRIADEVPTTTAAPTLPAAPAAPAGLPPMEEILGAPTTRGLNVSPALLEEIAQGLAGKPYNELIPAHQKTVIEMARRMEAGEGTVVPRQPPPEEPPPAPAAAPLELVPPAPPADTAAPTPEPPPTAPTNVFVKNNRLAKAVRAADRAAELGLTAKDIMQMDRDVFAAKVGEKSISGDTMAMVRDKLRRREADAAKAAAPGLKPTPTAQALANFEAEKAAKLRAKGPKKPKAK